MLVVLFHTVCISLYNRLQWPVHGTVKPCKFRGLKFSRFSLVGHFHDMIFSRFEVTADFFYSVWASQ